MMAAFSTMMAESRQSHAEEASMLTYSDESNWITTRFVQKYAIAVAALR